VIETDAHEGPVYVEAENALYFTTLPASSNIPVANSKQVAIRKISVAGGRFPLAPQAVRPYLLPPTWPMA
jgi:gluconolactonase